jgi:hypothetical protein
MIRTLGLNGFKGSGKDTVFSFLQSGLAVEKYGNLNVQRDAFADRLKLSAYRCFKPDATLEEALAWAEDMKSVGGISVYTLSDDPEFPDIYVSGREFLQFYGTEAHRDVFDKGFWVNAVPLQPGDDVDVLVITDCRFPNEAEAILSQPGSAVIEIVRDGVASDGHASEQPLPEELVTARIYNDGTLDDLRKNTLYLWEVLTGQENYDG